ncbi:hypothetical protein C0J52_08615 [Blattella germanica]|nr:hypothetical protein C0J52_08615 [Blattella germanica]
MLRISDFSKLLLSLVVLSAAAKTIETRSAPDQELRCSEETFTVVDSHQGVVSVTWPETISVPSDLSNSSVLENLPGAVVSEPMCLSASLEPVTRRCVQRRETTFWHPKEPPVCEGGVQNIQLQKCPPNFMEIVISENTTMCILISEQSKWTSVCAQHGATLNIQELDNQNLKYLTKILITRGLTRIWLPAKRHKPFGVFITRLPGSRWGSRYINSTKHPNFKLSKSWSLHNDCLSLRLKHSLLETTDCNENLPAVCILDISKEKSLMQVSCPKEYLVPKYYVDNSKRGFKIYHNLTESLTWEQAETVCRKNNQQGQLFQISSSYDNYLFLEMAKLVEMNSRTKCWIGLMKDADSFVWSVRNASLEKVNFVNWDSSSVTYFDTGTRGVINSNGSWSLFPEYSTLKCFVCEAIVDYIPPEMSVKYFPQYNSVHVRVYWPYGLWKENFDHKGFQCFTDADDDLIQVIDAKEIWSKNWTLDDIKMLEYIRNKSGNSNLNLDIHKKVYELIFNTSSPGLFWCQGHTIPNLELVESNTVLVTGEDGGRIYSMILDVHNQCIPNKNMTKCDPTFSNILETISEGVSKVLPVQEMTKVRAIKILDVYDNGTLKILFHLWIRGNRKLLTLSSNGPPFEFKEFIERYRNIYTFYSLKSTKACPPDITFYDGKGLHWKATGLGFTAVPVELCIGEEGVPINRKCAGDFVMGASWLEPSGRCHNNAISNITQSLYDLKAFVADAESWQLNDVINKTVALILNPSILSPADIFFVAKIMQIISRKRWDESVVPSITTVIKIVNQLQLARKECIQISQAFLNSSNILLNSLEDLVEKITDRSNYNIEGLHLAVSSQTIVQISEPFVSDVVGLILKRKDNGSNVYTESFTDFNVVPIMRNDTSNEFLTNLENAEVAVWVPDSVILDISKNGYLNECNTQSKNLNDNSEINRTMRFKIVVVIFYDDHIFQNVSLVNKFQCCNISRYGDSMGIKYTDSSVVTRVVSVSIPGYGHDLPAPIPIIFKPLVDLFSNIENKERKCSFWDFAYNSSTPSSSFGGWSSEGCLYAGNSTFEEYNLKGASSLSDVIDICVCTHLTHFSELVVGSNSRSTAAYGFYEDSAHTKALDIITLLGCSLSLIGIIGIIITAIVFRSWRQKPGTKVLLQLSLALGLQMILFILTSADVVNSTYTAYNKHCDGYRPPRNMDGTPAFYISDQSEDYFYDSVSGQHLCKESKVNRISCVIMGALLHYFVLSAFAWMLITALLQFFRYVKVLGVTRPPRFFIKAMLFGWGVPLIPVVLVLTISSESYTPPLEDSTLLCYPSGIPLYVGVLLPIGLIVSTNLVVYVMIIYNIMKIPERKDSCEGGSSLVFQQVRLGIVLFFLLGLSWIFGLIGALGAGVVFSYLFCIIATLQGFVLFIFFVICDPTTRLSLIHICFVS